MIAKKIFFITLFCMSLNLLVEKAFSFDEKKWNNLYRILNTEIRFLELKKNPDQKVSYRLFEAYSDRLKLIYEKENNHFIKSTSVRPKSFYFKKSKSAFKMTQNFGKKILKFLNICELKRKVHYRLAVNSRDFFDKSDMEKHLLLSLRKCSKDDLELTYNSMNSIADYYFNEKKFKKAAKYYLKLISFNDKWAPKYYYNLSWCFLKQNQTQKALKVLLKGHRIALRMKSTYLSDDYMKLFTLLFSLNNDEVKAISFFNTYSKDNQVDLLVDLLKSTIDRGKKKESIKIIQKINTLVKIKKFENKKIIFYRFLLKFYNDFKMYEQYFKKILLFHKTHFFKNNPAFLEEVLPDVKKNLSYLQLILKKEHSSRGRPSVSIVKRVVLYLDILTKIDPVNKMQYRFLQGEAYFEGGMFEDAITCYADVIKNVIQSKEDPYLKKSIDSFFAVTGKLQKFKPQMKEKIFEVFNIYIENFPNGHYADEVYKSLIHLSISRGQYARAQDLLQKFHQYFPQRLNEQKKLELFLLDKAIINKRKDLLLTEVTKIKNGLFNFSKSEISKINESVTQFFYKLYSLSLKKKPEDQYSSLEEILRSPHISSSDKASAQIAMSTLMMSLNNLVKSKLYLMKFLNQHQSLDDKREQVASLISKYGLLQFFHFVTEMSPLYFKRFCARKDYLNDDVFVYYSKSLAITKLDLSSLKKLKKIKKCLSHSQIYLTEERDFISQLIVKDPFSAQISRLIHFSSESSRTKSFYKGYLLNKFFVGEISWSQLIQMNKTILNLGLQTFLNDMNSFQNQWEKMMILEKKVIWDEDQFDAEKFNQALNKHLNLVSHQMSGFLPLLQSKYPEIVNTSLILLKKLTNHQYEFIQSLNPKGIDVEIQGDFKKEMKSIANNFKELFSKYSRDHLLFLKNLKKKNIFLKSPDLTKKYFIDDFKISNQFIPMDKI